ncbi:protein of unknown function [Lactiplantibacillus plantarum]
MKINLQNCLILFFACCFVMSKKWIEGWLTNHLITHMGPLVTTIIAISYRIGFVTVAMLAIPHLPGIRACFLPRQYLFRRLQRR